MADPSTAPPLTPSSIAEAHEKIKSYIHLTPLITCETLNKIASHPNPSSFVSNNPSTLTATNEHISSRPQPPKFNLYFKCENEQKIGAFKARGAHHALIRLISTLGIDHVRRTGVITHSSGNHAQALALAAANFNVPSHIVMPSISTPSKIAGTKMYTDKVYFSGSTSTEREALVAEIQAKTGAILVPPYDHPDIILGQGTTAFEMETQFRELKHQEQQSQPHNQNTTPPSSPSSSPPHFDAVLAPLGGGGLLAGVATWFSHTQPNTNSTITTNSTSTTTPTSTPPPNPTLIFGTEPSFSGANDAQLGLSQTPPTRIPHVSSLTIADGLRTPVGVLNWQIISDKSRVAGVYSVTETQIKWAMRLMMERAKVFVEPSAVVPVAVVLFNEEFRGMVAGMQQDGRAWDVGIVLSGGNTTVEAVAKLFGGEDEVREERQSGLVGMDGERKAEDVAG